MKLTPLLVLGGTVAGFIGVLDVKVTVRGVQAALNQLHLK